MTRKVAALLLLAAAGCKPDAPPPQEPAQPDPAIQQAQDALADIQAMLSGADAFSALTADLDYEPATETGLRFKSILEASARNELQFQADLKDVQPALILKPERLASPGGRQTSLNAVRSLGIAYDRYVYADSNTESRIGRLFEQLVPGSVGDSIPPAPVEQNRINGILRSMLVAYQNIIDYCGAVRPRLDDGDLLFRDNEEVIEYERLVDNASALETQLETALRTVLSVRRARVDRAFANVRAAIAG
ncbi:MAG: hypothetical protein IH945_08010 [Armatimonadetes bacterium]|nr:hypothetical protein [Armatimonadota bacterium]